MAYAQRAEKSTVARTRHRLFRRPQRRRPQPGNDRAALGYALRGTSIVKAGDTVNLRAGTYQALISWTKGGTPTAPITIQAYRGEDVTLQGSEQYRWTQVDRSDLRPTVGKP